MLLEIFLHVGVFTHSTDKSIVDKAHVGVELLVGRDIFFFCRLYALSFHLREIYRQHQQRMVKFVGLIERSCKGGFRVGIRTLGVGILPKRLDGHGHTFLEAGDGEIAVGARAFGHKLTGSYDGIEHYRPEPHFIVERRPLFLAVIDIDCRRSDDAVETHQRGIENLHTGVAATDYLANGGVGGQSFRKFASGEHVGIAESLHRTRFGTTHAETRELKDNKKQVDVDAVGVFAVAGTIVGLKQMK